MKVQLQKIIDFLLYSNIFIGVCAVALAFTNQLTVTGEIKFDTSCWFVFASTVFTYSYLKSNSGKNISGTQHRHWAASHQQFSKNILLISLVCSVCFFLLLPLRTELIVAGLGVFTAFYGFFDIPFVKPKRKLRDYGIVKTFFVAIVWSVTTVIVPLQDSPVEPAMMVFLLLRRFLFIAALTLVFEIKDMEGDRRSNLKTVPMLLGVSNTKLLAQLILFLMMGINLVQYFLFDISLLNMAAINLSLLVSVMCIQPLKEETTEIWYYLVLDGMMVLQFIFVYLATKYWA
jgi:4-hydroxybenzoate polyprenyltransferase